jgi:hypothetical protein
VRAKTPRLMSNAPRCLVLSVFALFLCFSSSSATQVDVYPHELNPGDPFVIKVRGAASSQQITATIGGKEIPLSRCGDDCLIGIGLVDPDAQPGKDVVCTKIGPQQLNTDLSVKKAEYPEQHLELPERQVDLGTEDLSRVKIETEKLKEIWQVSTERLFQGRFIVPLPNPVITVYGARRILNNKTVSIHGGVDIRGTRGEKVKASNRGRVVLAENLFYGGNTVIIDHGLGIYTVYMHLDRAKAQRGDLVSKGDVIGFVGSSGRSTGPHLHFGVKIMAANANPLSLINLSFE